MLRLYWFGIVAFLFSQDWLLWKSFRVISPLYNITAITHQSPSYNFQLCVQSVMKRYKWVKFTRVNIFLSHFSDDNSSCSLLYCILQIQLRIWGCSPTFDTGTCSRGCSGEQSYILTLGCFTGDRLSQYGGYRQHQSCLQISRRTGHTGTFLKSEHLV